MPAPLPPPPNGLLGLQEVKDHLNVTRDWTAAEDTELQERIDAVVPVIEAKVGPLTPVEVTEFHDGGRDVVILQRRPVLSIESVRELGSGGPTVLTAYDPSAAPDYGYRLNAGAGLLYRTAGYGAGRFGSGYQNIEVVYTVGLDLPTLANIRLAGKIIIASQWKDQTARGAGGGFGLIQGGDDELVAVSGFTFPIPKAAWQYLEPHILHNVAIA